MINNNKKITDSNFIIIIFERNNLIQTF